MHVILTKALRLTRGLEFALDADMGFSHKALIHVYPKRK